MSFNSPVRLHALAAFVLWLGFAFSATARLHGAAASWRAGTGREKITPPAGVWMTGFAVRDHPAEGTAQDLWVKALAISDPAGRSGVLLTADLCGITRELSDRVAAELARRFGLPRSAVMTNVSHTHCSPWLPGHLAGLRIFPPDGYAKAAAYERELEQKMIQAGATALASLAPATLSWGEDRAGFAFNRRENPIKDMPARIAAGTVQGPSDLRVPTLAVRAADGRLRAVLVSYACHNTTLSGYRWHGDYAGCAQEELERRHPGATVLFALGCGGDANPYPMGEIEEAERHGRELADAADRALGGRMTAVAGHFSSTMEDLALTFARKPSDAELREAREQERPYKEMYQAWAAAVAAQLQAKGDAILNYPYPIQVWKLGNLSWAALGGEVVAEYGLRLRREIPGNLWVFGYSTDVMAYIPSERVLAQGFYEGKSSMIPYGRPSEWSPGLEDKIVRKTSDLVSRLAAAR